MGCLTAHPNAAYNMKVPVCVRLAYLMSIVGLSACLVAVLTDARIAAARCSTLRTHTHRHTHTQRQITGTQAQPPRQMQKGWYL